MSATQQTVAMPTFLHLPRHVRERIYRLHLTYDAPIDFAQHLQIVQVGSFQHGDEYLPSLLRLSKTLEQEAAPFYYKENQFCFMESQSVSNFVAGIPKRFRTLIRSLSVTWDEHTRSASYDFDAIRKLNGLQELDICVNEKAMVQKQLRARNLHQRFAWGSDNPTSQQCLIILRYPSMSTLLKIGPIATVRFLEKTRPSGSKSGGPMPGGVLETQVAPKLMGRGVTAKSVSKSTSTDKHFPFLSLSPEIRNEIYELVLCFDGQLKPSFRPPLSLSKLAIKKGVVPPNSVLELLCVNHQVHCEAMSIFYNRNSFEFEWTTHLHAFLASIGPGRQKHIRDLKLHYFDVKSGGIGQIDLTYPMLKKLTGLRKLHVIMHGDLARKVITRYWQPNFTFINKANPVNICGMKTLFELRGVTDICVSDTKLEEKMEIIRKASAYPDFQKCSLEWAYTKVSSALAHFNFALAAAQSGIVCAEILEDDQWHTKDSFPVIEGRQISPEL
ncbi:hypothetical protein LTR62_008680 [Meristemomyces frigidus]|uniref:Uncharacterized protein n=1 Tax=Meristemomyces frigidus TaxID=1508187 RepID=A0AAN7YH18_9PEZI|nr:hypothetical protein LTR62_008680 [Meristemomyces frigidus]